MSSLVPPTFDESPAVAATARTARPYLSFVLRLAATASRAIRRVCVEPQRRLECEGYRGDDRRYRQGAE